MQRNDPSPLLLALAACFLLMLSATMAQAAEGGAGDSSAEHGAGPDILDVSTASSRAELLSQLGTGLIELHLGADYGGLARLDVSRAQVFADGARRFIDNEASGATNPEGRLEFYRGHLSGRPDTIAALTVDEDGTLLGLVNDGARILQIRQDPGDSWLQVGALEPIGRNLVVPQFDCATELLERPPDLALERGLIDRQIAPEPLPDGQYYQATIAVETDYGLFESTGSAAAAEVYIGSLFNYIGAIYEREVQTRLVIGDLFLWSSPDDPWETTTTIDRLYEFRAYWQGNRQSVDRALAHFLSAEPLGGGVAWIDALCSDSYGFGLSADLSGEITINGGIAWDAIVTAHEIGHIFSSEHTHCYGGIDGIEHPVDACYSGESGSGCWQGRTSLPGEGGLTGGQAGTRAGTIMSYCHLLGGGMSNIASTFGDTTSGIGAGRVIDRMAQRAAFIAAQIPSCMPVVGTSLHPLTVTKLGNGVGSVTGDPDGISCGRDCRWSYPQDSVVTLTATPGANSMFIGWSGDCVGSSATCQLAMTKERSISAAFALDGAAGCPAEVALSSRKDRSDWRDLLNNLRDHTLAGSPEGRELIEAYYRHGNEVSKHLIHEPRLALRGLFLLRMLEAKLRDAAVGLAADLDEPQRRAVRRFAAALRERASPGLAADLDRFVAMDWDGLTQSLRRQSAATRPGVRLAMHYYARVFHGLFPLHAPPIVFIPDATTRLP